MKFPGFSAEAVAFLADLKRNNDREWFTPRKQFYEENLRLPMIELVRAIHGEMLTFAPKYVGEPGKSVFRIYRDTRFAKDKTPYKTHIAASFFRQDKVKEGAGFYFAISPEGVHIGGGLYAADPVQLLKVRQLIANDPTGFRKTFHKLTGEPGGETTTRPPKGFDPTHPAIDLIKRKQHICSIHLEPALAMTPKLVPEVVKRFKAMTPMVLFLDSV